MHRRTSFFLGIACLAMVTLVLLAATRAEDSGRDAALERTRKQVRMLDDIYKTTVVLITDKYVAQQRGLSGRQRSRSALRGDQGQGLARDPSGRRDGETASPQEFAA